MALFGFESTDGRADGRRAVIVAAVAVVAVDQVSKSVALQLIGDVDWSFGPFRFTIVRNPGGPFGVADGASFFWTGVTAAILITAVAFVGHGRLDVRPAVAVGAVIGGGVGNLLDRLFRHPGAGRGAVIDWISIEPYPRVFNLADLALRAGAATVFVMMLVTRDETSSRKQRGDDRIPIAHRHDDATATRADEVPTIAVVLDLDDGSFFAALDGTVTIVDFWAPWCSPCKQLHPLFGAQAADHADDGLQFARVNVDESPGVATAFNVMSIPTIIVVADGHELEREIGLPGKRRLKQLVRSAGLLAGEFTGHGAT